MSHSEEGPGRRGRGTHYPTMSKGGPEAEGGAGVSSHHPDFLVCICQRAPADPGSAAISQGPRLHCARGGLPKAGPAPLASVSF